LCGKHAEWLGCEALGVARKGETMAKKVTVYEIENGYVITRSDGVSLFRKTPSEVAAKVKEYFDEPGALREERGSEKKR